MNLHITGEIIKTFDLEILPDSTYSDDDWHFRIELIADHKNEGRITARIWRKEFYRMQPTFPQEGDQPKSEPCDELFFVDETHILNLESIVSSDWKTTLSLVIGQLNERFNIK